MYQLIAMQSMQSTWCWCVHPCRRAGLYVPRCGDVSRERRKMSRSSSLWLIAVVALGLAAPGFTQPVPPNNTPDATLRSTPENVVWGYFAADVAPALTIKSGQTVRIDTVSHSGVNT